MITLLPALAACWAAAAPLEIGRPVPLQRGEGHTATLRPGYYAVFAEAPFTMTGEDGQPGASSWHGGFHTAAFTLDKPERVTLAAGPAPKAAARYQVFSATVPFRLSWLAAGDPASPVRPALEDPPQSADITVSVETIDLGVQADGPVSVAWRLTGLSPEDVTCPKLSGRSSWAAGLPSRRLALCRTRDRRVQAATTPFSVDLTASRGTTLPPAGSLLPSSRPDAVRNR